MTSVSTHNLTFTRTHTATHLTEVILGTIGDILAHLGISRVPVRPRLGAERGGHQRLDRGRLPEPRSSLSATSPQGRSSR